MICYVNFAVLFKSPCIIIGSESLLAGGKMKEAGIEHWISPNTGATNETGFTALPSGNRIDNGTFEKLREYGYWWSATEYSSSGAYGRQTNYATGLIQRGYSLKNNGFSVRCMKD